MKEEDTPLSVDEATMTIGKTVYFKAGQYALPFGNFNSNMISDPITVDIDETYQSAAAAAMTGSGHPPLLTCLTATRTKRLN